MSPSTSIIVVTNDLYDYEFRSQNTINYGFRVLFNCLNVIANTSISHGFSNKHFLVSFTQMILYIQFYEFYTTNMTAINTSHLHVVFFFYYFITSHVKKMLFNINDPNRNRSYLSFVDVNT